MTDQEKDGLIKAIKSAEEMLVRLKEVIKRTEKEIKDMKEKVGE